MNISDVQLLLAAPQAAGGYLSPGTVYNSLGRWASTTQLNASVSLNNLFPDLTGPQNAAGQVDYQCLFVYNTDTEATMANVYAWIPSTSVTGAVQWATGADTTVPSGYNVTGNPQAGYISSPTIAPSTVQSWYGPVGQASQGARLMSIGPGEVSAFWVRRTAVNSQAFSGAGFGLQVTFDVA